MPVAIGCLDPKTFLRDVLCYTFEFLAGAPKRAQDGGMKTLPQNIVPFVLRGLPPLNKLDQNVMRKLRNWRI